MEQLTFGLDSTEERDLVLPPTKAQRLLAVLNAAIVRSGCEYGTVPYWPPFDRGDYGNMNYVGEARSEPTSTHATPGIRPT